MIYHLSLAIESLEEKLQAAGPWVPEHVDQVEGWSVDREIVDGRVLHGVLQQGTPDQESVKIYYDYSLERESKNAVAG